VVDLDWGLGKAAPGASAYAVAKAEVGSSRYFKPG